MTRKFSLASFAASQCLIFGLTFLQPAQAATPPNYFFSQWTVSANCTEPNAGPAARVDLGLKLKISSNAANPDGSYSLQTINTGGKRWAGEWNGLKLEYRPGTKMTTVPADFECVAGAEASSAAASSFLAMSGYVQTAEPQYTQAHWYGLAKIHGQLEHVMIFPRDTSAGQGGPSVIIVLASASASSDINLDDDGVIHGN